MYIKLLEMISHYVHKFIRYTILKRTRKIYLIKTMSPLAQNECDTTKQQLPPQAVKQALVYSELINSNTNVCTEKRAVTYKDVRPGPAAVATLYFFPVSVAFIFRYHGSVFGRRSADSVFIRCAFPPSICECLFFRFEPHELFWGSRGFQRARARLFDCVRSQLPVRFSFWRRLIESALQ